MDNQNEENQVEQNNETESTQEQQNSEEKSTVENVQNSDIQTSTVTNNQNTYQSQSNVNNDNTKIYRILSYIGILWIVSLFVKEKDQADVKFHAGQGMILTIVNFGLNVIFSVIGFIIGIFVGLTGVDALATFVSLLFSLLGWAVSVITLVLMIFGIINANDNKSKELPVIGKFAFYK